ncbi:MULTISPECIES: alpha/beta fold hydrolase [Bradyrhizobium]|uniref:alpha/beta fold hydrolase n=1 Tax=Bradyrhizobium TaxID=374 RepID=UPI000A1945A1|nr:MULTISPECIES: alpha/beta hydrolase [Bradyrhizobium]OSI79078.1 alpha/beta hydrolase [Bradyrhizobium canariense]WOH60377.1 alpha/beta hydrolase [Bradyrhizobium sp. BWC-3-1]
MTTLQTALLITAAILILAIASNLLFSRLAERRNPAIGKFLNSDGVLLHYIERGDPSAPCVVLFHGNGSMIQDFVISGIIERLAHDNRVVCFDRPGFGYSQRPRSRIWTATAQAALFVKALDQLGVRDPVVLGHSWGALVAIALSLRSDYPIRRLVLASGYYFPTTRLDVWLMSSPAVPVLGDLLSYTIAPIVSWAILPAAFRKIFAPRSVPQTFKSEFPASLSLRPKQLRAAAEESALLIPTAAQLQASYSNIDCQVHIFHGADDQIIEPKQARDLHQALHHSDFHLVPNAGHMVTHADPDAIAQAANTMPSSKSTRSRINR